MNETTRCYQQVGPVVGEGAFKTVYALKNRPDRVVSVQEWSEEALQELKIHQLVARHGLAPRVYEGKRCRNDKLWVVSERMDMNARELGQRQGAAITTHRPILLFTERQMRQMIQLCQALTRLGIRHGDLKLANILWKKDRFTVVDFGFSRPAADDSFAWGFTGNMGCPEQDTKVDAETARQLEQRFNLWQLWTSLSAEPLVLIGDSNSTSWSVFMGFDRSPDYRTAFPASDSLLYRSVCNRDDEDVQKLRQELARERRFREKLISMPGFKPYIFGQHHSKPRNR